jgi:hypothetical protein
MSARRKARHDQLRRNVIAVQAIPGCETTGPPIEDVQGKPHVVLELAPDGEERFAAKREFMPGLPGVT